MDKIKNNIKDILIVALSLTTIGLFMYNLKIKKDLDKSSTIAANYIAKDLNHAANLYFKNKKTEKIKNEIFNKLDKIKNEKNKKTINDIKKDINKMKQIILAEDKSILIKVGKDSNNTKK